MYNYSAEQTDINTEVYYENLYSLWGDSYISFDPRNICFGFGDSNWSTPEPKKPDLKSRRVISRDVLYEDPDAIYDEDYYFGGGSGQSGAARGCEWPRRGDTRRAPRRQTALERKLNEILEPARISKGESMMQKMRWRGLDCGSERIIQPIGPKSLNGVYTNNTIYTQPDTENDEPKIDPESREFFYTNVLLHILEFVKNDSEIEVLFDNALWKHERMRIHHIVSDIVNSEDIIAMDFDNVNQMHIVQEIYEHSYFVLGTQSDGEPPDRYLCLYKEAPPHVYLITPNDVYEKYEIIEKDDCNNNLEPEEITENPFLRSITRNLKSENIKQFPIDAFEYLKTNKIVNKQLKILNKFIDFFLEFVGKGDFVEFRFLGPFDLDEAYAIKYFIDMCKVHLGIDAESMEGDAMVLDAMNSKLMCGLRSDVCGYDIKEDSNGSPVIYKMKANVKMQSIE